jgi:hypothetical protein
VAEEAGHGASQDGAVRAAGEQHQDPVLRWGYQAVARRLSAGGEGPVVGDGPPDAHWSRNRWVAGESGGRA